MFVAAFLHFCHLLVMSEVELFYAVLGSAGFRGGCGKLCICPVMRRLCSGVLHVRRASVGGQVRSLELPIFGP